MADSIELRKKICLLGDPAVGKTSLIRKYVFNEFSETYIHTIGTEVTKKEVVVDFRDKSNVNTKYDVNFAIWDIIGQKEYRTLISRFYKNASGALLVCDLTRKDTLYNLTEWASALFGAIGKVPIIIVGNKFDLVDQNSFKSDDLFEFSCRYGASFIPTSAKNGQNVEQIFFRLGELMVKYSLFFEKMNSLMDVLDAIIVDFCEVNGGIEIGMPLFKEEFTKIPHASLKEPNKEIVDDLISALINVTKNNKGKEIADYQSARFNNWFQKVN